MSNLNIERQHHLGIEQTRRLVDEWIVTAQQKYGMVCKLDRQPDRDIVSIKRTGFDGTLNATGESLSLQGTVSFLLRGFLPKIEQTIEQTMDDLLKG